MRDRQEWLFFTALPRADRTLAIVWWAILVVRVGRPGPIGPGDLRPQSVRGQRVGAHARPAQADQVQPAVRPVTFGGRSTGFWVGVARSHARIMHHPPTRPTTWRALPTLLIVVVALALGAVTARAQPRPAHQLSPAPHPAVPVQPTPVP